MGRAGNGQRMFAALVPSESAIEDLEEFLAPRRAAAPYRWSMPEQFHVTLAFCDSVEDFRVEPFIEVLEEAAGRRTPFEARIAGGGAFPDPSRGRVLYADVVLGEPESLELERLSSGCRTAATRAGIEVDGQRFRPHITLARLNRPTELTRWIRLLDAYSGPAWTAVSVTLLASHLGEGPHGRPRYEVLAEVPVGG